MSRLVAKPYSTSALARSLIRNLRRVRLVSNCGVHNSPQILEKNLELAKKTLAAASKLTLRNPQPAILKVASPTKSRAV